MFSCSNCSKEYSKWQGQCDNCSEWNTLQEIQNLKFENKKKKPSRQKSKIVESILPVSLDSIQQSQSSKVVTGISEFDNTVGGSLIGGQVVLLAGSPGVGKSTLSLLITEKVASKANRVLYIAGEESPEQIKHRADRLQLTQKHVDFIPEVNIEALETFIASNINKYGLILIDSIQTLYSHDITSSSGSVAQVSECTDRLVNLAKGYSLPMIIIGHITKSGNIAGPKILEHMVDTVLYFEGDKQYEHRMLRVEKNRYGSTDEVGLFKMTDLGLIEVNDVSDLFDSKREAVVGSTFSIALEGNRPIVIEVQALATKSYFEIPRRTTSGFDKSRLHIILAIADKILKLKTYQYDIYVNITGGFSIKDPGLDLAVLQALISSIQNKVVQPKSIFFGEVGLTGEIRKVLMQEKRSKEAKRLGFSNIHSSVNVQTVKELLA